MGKITVKHYLNTNLKPYIINGEKYYSIYSLVTVNRQNTKVKSVFYNEYYTEKDFTEIMDKTNKEDFENIDNEVITITNLINILLREFDDFDFVLFSAIYNFYQTIHIFDVHIENHLSTKDDGTNLYVSLYEKDQNKAGLSIDTFFIEPFSIKENQSKGMSLFTWYSKFAQAELKQYLINNNCLYDIERTIFILNQIVFYNSFDILNWIIKGSKKFNSLQEKYYSVFNNFEQYVEPYYLELWIEEKK